MSNRKELLIFLATAFVGSLTCGALGEDRPRDVDLESPLRLIDGRTNDIGVHLELVPEFRDLFEGAGEVTLRDFVLGDGVRVDVQLRRIEVFSPNARIVLGTKSGDVPLRRPDVILLGGQVVGRPESTVFLSLSPHATNGFVRLGDDTFVISSGPAGQGGDIFVYDFTGLPSDAIDWIDTTCQVLDAPIPAGAMPAATESHPAESGSSDPPDRIVDMAIETDWEFTNDLFGGDTDTSSAYVATLIGAMSEIYARDVNTRLRISYLRVWSLPNDPWTVPDLGQLTQFRVYWNANMGYVQRDVAHFLSGRPLGGGVAYLPGLCIPGWEYGLSANLAGYFPYPLRNHSSQNWDIFVVSHETGHNFGSDHTHCYDPPVDRCSTGCHGGDRECGTGTIMSYCHGCPGGMTNILLAFHPRVINEGILPYLASVPCSYMVDLFDFRYFLDCVTGPSGGVDIGCRLFDYDQDTDVDFADFSELQRALGGSN